MLQKLQSRLELTGSFVAIACAIHCISIPIILSLGSIGAFHWFEHTAVELGFLFVTLSIASWSLFNSFRKGIVNGIPIVLFAFGFIALITSITLHWHILSAIGGTLIATAHYFNWRQLNQSKTEDLQLSK